jgi:hypothetical protein
MTGLTPRACPAADCVVNATFSNTEKLANIGYCRFGDVLVQADRMISGTLTCKVPMIDARSTMVSISFDSSQFSDVQMPLKIHQPPEVASDGAMPLFMLASVVVGLGVTIYKKMNSRHRAGARNNDRGRWDRSVL